MTQCQPRRLEACACCAVRDYLENRFEMYLFREGSGKTSLKSFFYGYCANDNNVSEGYVATYNDKFCAGPHKAITALLAVEKYAELMPRIPLEELHASSVQHPMDASARWLLHSRRVQVSHQTDRSAGIGAVDATVLVCKECLLHLGRPTHPTMPPLALANLMWLGRQHPRFKDLNIATRLLLGKGRACMRQIFLGQGPRDEAGKGLIGNTILLSQAEATPTHILPALSKTLDSFCIVFLSQCRRC